MEPFETDPAARLSELAPEVASTVVRVAGDIALVIGEDGVIRTVAEGTMGLHQDGQDWVGRPWVETVGDTARKKVELLLHEAQLHGVSQRRELNHPLPGGTDIPVSWAAVRLGNRGPVLAVGRDLRAIGAIQQRFWTHSRRWSASTGAAARPKAATGSCSRWRKTPCWCWTPTRWPCWKPTRPPDRCSKPRAPRWWARRSTAGWKRARAPRWTSC
jgi:hypothetical protein